MKLRALLLAPLALSGCAIFTNPPPPAPPAPPAKFEGTFGLKTEDEARLLAMEDQRLFDAGMAREWLANQNPLQRTRMALALGRIGPSTFVDTNQNGEQDAGERQAGVEQLVALVHDPDRNVRTTAAFALGEIGDASSIDALLELAHDTEDAGVAAEAIEALSKMAAQVPFAHPAEFARYAELAGTAQREGVRARTIEYLFRFNTDEASELAATSLDSPSPLIRQVATYALSRRAYAPARERLELLAGDAAYQTRANVAAALGRIGAKESEPLLITLLYDAHPWVRTNALVALARLAAKDAHALDRPQPTQFADDALRIIELTSDPDPGTRASSIDILGWYAERSEQARTRLLEIAANGSRWDRELAAGAIARHLPAELAGIVDGASPWARVRILENTKDAEAGIALRKRFAADADPLVRSNALANVPDGHVDAELDLVRAALDDADAIVRANAIERYSFAKSPDLALLTAAEERTRHDSQNDARLAAITAIAGIDAPTREAFLRGLVADRDPVVRRTAVDLIVDKLKKPRLQYTPLITDRTADDYAKIVEWSHQPHRARIFMTRGSIDIALTSQDAPITAWNFAQLAAKGYFNDTSFMRVVPNFVIQGGDPRNDMNGGPGYAIRDEINLQKYTRGAVGMALSGPDTGGSQFFITHSPQPHLDGGYTIFGRVVAGMNDVVDQTERGDRVETITIDGGAH
jgi:cyclophilin family peptidyl-prolyl cis-trans isomerase/HEAT repeat protein